jgi:hypothetical protein
MKEDALRSAISTYFSDKGNFGVEDFAFAYGDPRQALLLFRLFYPELVEVAGHVVLKTHIHVDEEPERLIGKLEENPSHVQEILSGYRWLEIPELFANDFGMSKDAYRVLADLVAQAWGAVLRAEFPGRLWITRILDGAETGGSVGVEFGETA